MQFLCVSAAEAAEVCWTGAMGIILAKREEAVDFLENPSRVGFSFI